MIYLLLDCNMDPRNKHLSIPKSMVKMEIFSILKKLKYCFNHLI